MKLAELDAVVQQIRSSQEVEAPRVLGGSLVAEVGTAGVADRLDQDPVGRRARHTDCDRQAFARHRGPRVGWALPPEMRKPRGDPGQRDEVWALLDRHYLTTVARRGPEPVFATISGAHEPTTAAALDDLVVRLRLDAEWSRPR